MSDQKDCLCSVCCAVVRKPSDRCGQPMRYLGVHWQHYVVYPLCTFIHAGVHLRHTNNRKNLTKTFSNYLNIWNIFCIGRRVREKKEQAVRMDGACICGAHFLSDSDLNRSHFQNFLDEQKDGNCFWLDVCCLLLVVVAISLSRYPFLCQLKHSFQTSIVREHCCFVMECWLVGLGGFMSRNC